MRYLTEEHANILLTFTGNQYRAFRKAHATLMRMGVSRTDAACILLDAYSTQRLDNAYRTTLVSK